MNKIKITYSNRNPWITRKLLDEIIKRKKLHAKSKKTPTEANILEYKEYKNTNLTNQRIAETDYFRKQFDLQTHDMRKTFKVIRTILDKDTGINVCKTVDFIIGNRFVCDYNDISNKFNDYFVYIGSILANSIHCNVNPLFYVDNIPNSIVIPDISQEAVISIIKSLKNSAPGYDDMPTSVIKKCINDYIAPLSYLVNISIKQGIFLDELKSSNILQTIDLISVTFFSKIFEKIFANRIIDFLDQNDVFHDHQYGLENVIRLTMLLLH